MTSIKTVSLNQLHANMHTFGLLVLRGMDCVCVMSPGGEEGRGTGEGERGEGEGREVRLPLVLGPILEKGAAREGTA